MAPDPLIRMKGANLWICAPSSESVTNAQAGVVTTDVTGMEGFSTDDYANDFGGTSAAAPIVSGVAALMRSAKPRTGLEGYTSYLSRHRPKK